MWVLYVSWRYVRTCIYMELAIISLQYLDLRDIFLRLIELPPWHGWSFFLLSPFTVYAAVWLMLPNDCFCHSYSRALQRASVDDCAIKCDSCIGHSHFSCSLIFLISNDYNHESYHLISIYNTLGAERIVHYFLFSFAIKETLYFLMVSVDIFLSGSHHPMVAYVH